MDQVHRLLRSACDSLTSNRGPYHTHSSDAAPELDALVQLDGSMLSISNLTCPNMSSSNAPPPSFNSSMATPLGSLQTVLQLLQHAIAHLSELVNGPVLTMPDVSRLQWSCETARALVSGDKESVTALDVVPSMPPSFAIHVGIIASGVIAVSVDQEAVKRSGGDSHSISSAHSQRKRRLRWWSSDAENEGDADPGSLADSETEASHGKLVGLGIIEVDALKRVETAIETCCGILRQIQQELAAQEAVEMVVVANATAKVVTRTLQEDEGKEKGQGLKKPANTSQQNLRAYMSKRF